VADAIVMYQSSRRARALFLVQAPPDRSRGRAFRGLDIDPAYDLAMRRRSTGKESAPVFPRREGLRERPRFQPGQLVQPRAVRA
jgi:hypothetical protein